MRPGWLQQHLILLMLLAVAADAQEGIAGKVVDDTGVAVAQAQIEARLGGAEKPVSTVSDASGDA